MRLASAAEATVRERFSSQIMAGGKWKRFRALLEAELFVIVILLLIVILPGLRLRVRVRVRVRVRYEEEGERGHAYPGAQLRAGPG